jgi:YHS domain-containing protein
MKHLILPTIALFLLGLAAYATKASPTTGPATQPGATASKPVNKLCPLSKEEVDPKVTVDYKGKTVGFCCEDCIPKFKADPDKYMASLK